MAYIEANHIVLNDASSTVDEVFDHLAQLACQLGHAGDAQALIEAFQEREDQGSTGMVEGIALPHAKGGSTNKPAVLGLVLKEPIEAWESQDGMPIKAVLGLITPENDSSTHLKMLSKLALLLMDQSFCNELLEVQNTEHIAQCIAASLQDLEI